MSQVNQIGVVVFCAIFGYLIVWFVFEFKKSKSRIPRMPVAPPPIQRDEVQRARDLFDLGTDVNQAQLLERYHALLSKYHPDKTQHLGHEFQQLAETKTREIIQAYHLLSKLVNKS